MTTNYPSSLDSYSTKVDNVTDVVASHINDLQDAVVAIETELGTQPRHTAAAAPTANDDTGDGFSVGTIWTDTTNDDIYICIDNSSGAAIWINVGTHDHSSTAEGGTSISGATITGGTVDLNGGTDNLVLDADADTTISAPTDDQIDVELAGVDVIRFLNGAGGDANVWRLGDDVLTLDFTGTNYDTDAEMQAVGIRLSDADTPFPDTLIWTVSGTWSHSAGNGWLAAPGGDAQGPAMIIPLCRPGNWEMIVTINYSPGDAAHQMGIYAGYITNSNHMGAAGGLVDADAVNSEVSSRLLTNDGDDTVTVRYTGTDLAGTGSKEFRFRCKNGCVSVWDPQDTAWHDYEGRQTSTVSYTAAYAFIQSYKYTGATYATTYITSLTLTYLL